MHTVLLVLSYVPHCIAKPAGQLQYAQECVGCIMVEKNQEGNVACTNRQLLAQPIVSYMSPFHFSSASVNVALMRSPLGVEVTSAGPFTSITPSLPNATNLKA